MKDYSNLHLMQDAEERRSMIKTYYRQGLKRGMWYGLFIGFILMAMINAILIGLGR